MTLHYNSRFNPLISQKQPDYHQVYQRSSVTSLGSVASGYSASALQWLLPRSRAMSPRPPQVTPAPPGAVWPRPQ